MNLSPHFRTEEFQCKHCGLSVVISEELLVKLEILRHLLGDVPITITSGYRCPDHNQAVGGASGSYHVKGMAADIKVDGFTPAAVATAAERVGFTGIGVYSSWTHVDVREGEDKVKWCKIH